MAASTVDDMTPPPAPPLTPPPELSIPLPATWRRRRDPARGVLVAARPHLPGLLVVPQLTVRCTPVAATDLARWRVEALDELAHRLSDFELEDDDVYDTLAGETAYHRFAHRDPDAGGTDDDVLCDQWSWLVDGWGVTLTCSVARIDYPAWCDVFESIAESVDLIRAAA